MPITNREEARESGFAQVREAMLSFEGDVISAEFDKYPPRRDEDGELMPEKEYLEISCDNVEVLEVSEELSMPVDDWNFRVNCSEFKGSFWIEDFLLSADRAKLLIPNDLAGKRIVWKKATRKGTVPMYDSTNFIIGSVKTASKAAPKVVAPPKVPTDQTQENSPSEEDTDTTDPMELFLKLAVDKTETQFRSAVSLHPAFVNSPLLSMAKGGLITKQLVADGKLEEVQEGDKTVYQKPE